MDRRENEHRQSSLPSSLIPHLYTGPQSPREISAGATLTTISTIPPLGLEQEEIAPRDIPYIHPVSPTYPLLPPIVPSMPQVQSAEDSRRNAREYFRYRSPEPDDAHDSDASAARPPDSLVPMIRHSVGSSSIPHGSNRQHFAGPIYSAPVFHPSRLQITPHVPSYTFPPPAPREPTLSRGPWREGEAGPSSLLHSGHHDHGVNHRGRRGTSQPARLIPHTDASRPEADAKLINKRERSDKAEGYFAEMGDQVQRTPPPEFLQIPPLIC